jgi:transglutaminase-like putative cysteine protease
MKLTVSHTLTFSLGTPSRAVQHLLLTVLPTPQQKIERWSIEMPGFAEAAVFRDGYGNRAHLVSQVKPEPEIVVKVSGTVETFDKAGVLGRLDYDPMPAMYRRVTELTKPNEDVIAGLKDGPDRIALFHELMDRVHGTVGGSAQSQTQSQDDRGQSQSQPQMRAEARDAAEVAHRFIAAVRALGIPARYVTGYLLDEGKSSFRAWAEAWDERLGWIGFDPVLNICPTETHIRIASGLDATATMPVRTAPAWAEMPRETVEIAESGEG